ALMSNNLDQPAADPFVATAIPAIPRKKGCTVLAWIAIVLLVGLVLLLHTVSPPEASGPSGQGLDVRLMQIQARYLVGAKDLFGIAGKDLYEQAKSMNNGRVEQRLRFVVLAGELEGPAEAFAQLNQLEHKLPTVGVQ